jgi:hypothetical protein
MHRFYYRPRRLQAEKPSEISLENKQLGRFNGRHVLAIEGVIKLAWENPLQE